VSGGRPEALPDDLAALARELDGVGAALFGASGGAEKEELPDLSGSDFRLVRAIGRGGMGVVCEAEQLSLGRRVAVKVLPRSLGGDPERAERFVAEARLAAGLHHPGIVSVFGAGQSGGVLWYAMELVEGETAADRPPGSVREAAELVLEVASALAYAHACGVRHGDVKPANLLVSADGRVRLADFGLAGALESGAGEAAGGGTARYLAPEVRAGGAATAAADQYALGVTLRELCPAAPDRELAAVVGKATAARPEERYANVEALARDLRRWLAGEPVHARGPSMWRSLRFWAKRRRGLAAALAALAALAAAWTGGLTADWAERRAEAREAARDVAALAEATDELDASLHARAVPDAGSFARGDATADALLGRHPGAAGAVSGVLRWRRAKATALRAAGDDKGALREFMRLSEITRLFFLNPDVPDADREELVAAQLDRLERAGAGRELARRTAEDLRWELGHYRGARAEEFRRRLEAATAGRRAP
jgi:hypothetical protein